MSHIKRLGLGIRLSILGVHITLGRRRLERLCAGNVPLSSKRVVRTSCVLEKCLYQSLALEQRFLRLCPDNGETLKARFISRA